MLEMCFEDPVLFLFSWTKKQFVNSPQTNLEK
jgi:hypothetical protein